MQLNNYIRSAKLLRCSNIFTHAFKEDSLFYVQKSTILVEILINVLIRALINTYMSSVYLIQV